MVNQFTEVNSMDNSRRKFLFGGFNKVKKITESALQKTIANNQFYLRPPGAVSEKDFIQLCDESCVACLTTCPTYVIQKVQEPEIPEHYTAYIDPRIAGCSYCHDFPCIAVCPTGALTGEGKPMGVATILNNCITIEHEFCEICYHSCPEEYQALYKDKNGVLKVNEDKCVGCGSCVSACFLRPEAIEILPLKNQSETT